MAVLAAVGGQSPALTLLGRMQPLRPSSKGAGSRNQAVELARPETAAVQPRLAQRCAAASRPSRLERSRPSRGEPARRRRRPAAFSSQTPGRRRRRRPRSCRPRRTRPRASPARACPPAASGSRASAAARRRSGRSRGWRAAPCARSVSSTSMPRSRTRAQSWSTWRSTIRLIWSFGEAVEDHDVVDRGSGTRA